MPPRPTTASPPHRSGDEDVALWQLGRAAHRAQLGDIPDVDQVRPEVARDGDGSRVDCEALRAAGSAARVGQPRAPLLTHSRMRSARS